MRTYKQMNSVFTPEVGIVIANHNNEAFVAEAIQSVARQTVKNIRVIVVDDNSDDGSDEIIRAALDRLDDHRFSYVGLERRLGQAGAVREGLDLLPSPFVCVLDSDDVW